MSSDEDFLLVLAEALVAVGLEAIIIGATAAAVQGVPIMTRDVDLLVRDTPDNRGKIEALAIKLKTGSPQRVSDLSSAVSLIGGRAPVDIIFDEIPGKLSFSSIRSRAKTFVVGSCQLQVASLADVIASKQAAGRPKDIAQLAILQAAARVELPDDEA